MTIETGGAGGTASRVRAAISSKKRRWMGTSRPTPGWKNMTGAPSGGVRSPRGAEPGAGRAEANRRAEPLPRDVESDEGAEGAADHELRVDLLRGAESDANH